MKDFIDTVLNPLETLKRLNFRIRKIEFLLGIKKPLDTYANNAAAISGGLESGEFYKTSDGTIKVVY